MRDRRFRPEYLGSHLQADFLDDYELSAEEFAHATRLPLERVQGILAGCEPIDADLALRLAKLFGGSPAGWLSWENGHELWHARERIRAELEVIVPLDPNTRVSLREDEPLEPELIEELRRRIDDIRDSRRWIVVSQILGGDVSLHEESTSRMFYNVESNCYSMSLDGATAFKNREAAEAVAAALGERVHTVEVTTQDLERPRRNDAVDNELRERFFEASGQGMSTWDVGTYLRDASDMAAYLQAASQHGDSKLIATAVADVLKAMAEQTTVAYLRERGELGEDRAAFDTDMR